MIVVEDKDGVVWYVIGNVDEGGQNGFGVWGRSAKEKTQQGFPDAWSNLFPCQQQVSKEALDVAIFLAGRQPGNWELARAGPLGKKRRLSVADGSRHEDKLIVGNLPLKRVDLLDAPQHLLRLRRNPYFGCQETGVHVPTTISPGALSALIGPISVAVPIKGRRELGDGLQRLGEQVQVELLAY